jgi:hypothetical protein
LWYAGGMRKDWWFGPFHVIRYRVVGGERYFGWQLSLPSRGDVKSNVDVFWGRWVFVVYWVSKCERV